MSHVLNQYYSTCMQMTIDGIAFAMVYINDIYQGLPEPSSLRGSTLGTRAAEHKGCNWGMQID